MRISSILFTLESSLGCLHSNLHVDGLGSAPGRFEFCKRKKNAVNIFSVFSVLGTFMKQRGRQTSKCCFSTFYLFFSRIFMRVSCNGFLTAYVSFVFPASTVGTKMIRQDDWPIWNPVIGTERYTCIHDLQTLLRIETCR